MVLPDWLWIPACERIIVSYKYTFGIYILNLLAIVFQWISVPKAYYQALARATPCHLWPPNFSGSPESQTACLFHSEDMLVKNSISHTSSSILCPGHIFKPRGKNLPLHFSVLASTHSPVTRRTSTFLLQSM